MPRAALLRTVKFAMAVVVVSVAIATCIWGVMLHLRLTGITDTTLRLAQETIGRAFYGISDVEEGKAKPSTLRSTASTLSSAQYMLTILTTVEPDVQDDFLVGVGYGYSSAISDLETMAKEPGDLSPAELKRLDLIKEYIGATWDALSVNQTAFGIQWDEAALARMETARKQYMEQRNAP